MQKKWQFWQFLSFPLLAIPFGIALFGLIVLYQFKEWYDEKAQTGLESNVHQILPLLDFNLTSESYARLDKLTKRLKGMPHRYTVILANGKVVGDSKDLLERLDNHSDRPEFKTALQGKTGIVKRVSRHLDIPMVFCAVPVFKEGEVVAVVRSALPEEAFYFEWREFRKQVLFTSLVFIAVFTAMGLGLFSQILKCLGTLRQAIVKLARGDHDWTLPPANYRELIDLSKGIKTLSEHWARKIHRLESQRNEQQAVLSSMVEGVFAVDKNERLLSMNSAAFDLLGILPGTVQGRSIQEMIRVTDLQHFIRKVLQGNQKLEDDLVIHIRGEERFIQVHGTVLIDSKNEDIGALIVLNDVTRLRRLENIRKDFVANVSHELKTPITSIKGWVETLLGGGVEDAEESARFLKIISKQADRLHAIIEDLLSLSRIEQGAEKQEIELTRESLNNVIQSALISCNGKAAEKKLYLEVECDKALKWNLNFPLIEQALINLIDNAVKYSNPEKTIWIRAREESGKLYIEVEDEGCGIPSNHLSRLFERFYRVDPARSRKLGGTGLGLAIVKHIAQAHRGEVQVKSTHGEGSRFTIKVP